MKQHTFFYRILILSFLITVCPLLLFAQTALQEIVRFNCPWGHDFMPNVEANGDINGDGTPDLIFSCLNEEEGNYRKIYIYHSIPTAASVPDQILIAPPEVSGDYGATLSYSGDLNGDGIDDLVVSSSGYGPDNSGAVSIYYGGTSISETPDVVLYGADYPGDSWGLWFGGNIITGCNLNGDGYDDLIVSGSGPSGIHTGAVFVFFGGQQFSANCAWYKLGTADGEYLGRGLAAGDINGDGYDDIVLTRQVPITGTGNYNYILDIYAGGETLSSIPVFETIIGNDINGGMDSKLLANGDLNGDSFDDISYLSYSTTSSILNVIYGGVDFNSLSIHSNIFPVRIGRHLQSYCNFNDDAFIDFCVQQDQLTTDGPRLGYFSVFTQNDSALDLNYDFVNSGDFVFNEYGYCYYLGDINHDGFPEFFVFSNEYSPEPVVNFATILSEHSVGNDDETQPIPSKSIACYPNPFHDKVNVKFLNKQPQAIYDISIFDLRGRRVFNQKNIRSDSYIWDVKGNKDLHLSHGIYLLKITGNDNEKYTSKLVYSE